MSLTVAQAVERLQDEYLDDPNGVRWSAAVCKRALEVAQSSVLLEIADSGTDALRETESLTTDPTGEVALAALRVQTVSVVRGGLRIQIPRAPTAVAPLAGEALTLLVEYDGGVLWDSSDSRYLLDDGSGSPTVAYAGPGSAAIEEWIIARAALICMAKEPSARRAGASEAEGMQRSVVLRSLPRKRGAILQSPNQNVITDLYQWSHSPVTGTLVVGRSITAAVG